MHRKKKIVFCVTIFRPTVFSINPFLLPYRKRISQTFAIQSSFSGVLDSAEARYFFPKKQHCPNSTRVKKCNCENQIDVEMFSSYYFLTSLEMFHAISTIGIPPQYMIQNCLRITRQYKNCLRIPPQYIVKICLRIPPHYSLYKAV